MSFLPLDRETSTTSLRTVVILDHINFAGREVTNNETKGNASIIL